jgi:hypothetical protein
MRRLAALAAVSLLAACTPSSPSRDAANPGTAATADAAGPAPAVAASAGDRPSAGSRDFRSKEWGFHIDYPSEWTLQRDFDHGYLDNGAWKTYAAPGSKGTSVLALSLPGSNAITAGELRIGVSNAADEVRRCIAPPDAVRPGSVGEAHIGDVAFAKFEAADAAMGHYLSVRSYRTVHDGRCYAIDLLVTGTNPQVYDPPPTPPFTRAHAFEQLQQALQGFRFTR